ncbi:MAG: efflux RND transporter periplasmic adaptor subunit [Rikenellaceae bacterium]|nr:efflux RND transporter periplasmic adaptor subunit [Rikenellaceae bacterium]
MDKRQWQAERGSNMWGRKEKTEKEIDGQAEKETEEEKRDPEFAEQRPEEEMEQVLTEYLEADHSGKKKRGGVKRRLASAAGQVKGWSRKKKLLSAAALLAVLFLGSRACGGGEPAALPVVTAPLERGDVTAVLSLTGPVSGTESADVVSNLHAEVLEILVREGDRVEKGQILASLDSSDVKKTVDIAQNSYDLAVSEYEENIKNTQLNYEKAVQDLQTARLAYERNKVLFDAGDISVAELEGFANTMNDASRHAASFTVSGGKAVPDKSYELKVKSAQFELDQKKTDLENTEVRSPIDGTVTRVNSRVGQFADKPEDDKPMFIIENLDSLEMEIAVSEYSVGRIRVGQKAEVSADILDGEKAVGEIVSISPTGEEKGGGSTERVVPATIRIEGGSATGLMAGITARAAIVTGEAKDTFTVPQTALIAEADGGLSVAVADPDSKTVHMVPVTVGVESDLEAEIFPETEGGLSEGMSIILSPAGLSEGMAVTAVPGGVS